MSGIKAVSAYACGSCGKTFPKNITGKLSAGACCTYRQCKQGPSDMSYLGTANSLCRGCFEEAEWERVCENLTHALRDYVGKGKLFNRREPEIERALAVAIAGSGGARIVPRKSS